MIMDIQKELLRYPLHVLKWCGQSPEQSKIRYFSFAAVFVLLGSVQLAVIIIQFFYAKGDINATAQNIEGATSLCQFLGKVLVGSVKLDNFIRMTEDANKFWSIENYVGKIQEEIKNTFTRTLNLEKLFLTMVFFTMVLAIASPVLTKQLPSGQWTMTDHDTLYIYALILHEILVPVAATLFIGFDNLFLSFCTLLTAQFKMLKCLLNDLKVSVIFNAADERMYSEKLISYVQYHEFLLRFSEVLRDTYSPVMLIEYSTVLMVLCGDMYVLFESEDIFHFIRFIIPIVAVLIQLAFYCIPLNYVTDEGLSISQGIYDSDWNSKHISSLKNTIPLIMLRSQREIKFTAGGLVEMNCRTILSVVRMSYSICTIMRALKKV